MIDDGLLLELAAEEQARAEAFMFWVFVFLGVWTISMIAAAAVGSARRRAGAGFLCGFILGPVGIVAALFLPAGEEEKTRKPGAPVSRQRGMPVKVDPIEEFEARERAKEAFEGVPGQMRGKSHRQVVVPLKRAKYRDEDS